MKYEIDSDEWYPVYMVRPLTPHSITRRKIIELSDEEFLSVKDAFESFERIQDFLRDKYKSL